MWYSEQGLTDRKVTCFILFLIFRIIMNFNHRQAIHTRVSNPFLTISSTEKGVLFLAWIPSFALWRHFILNSRRITAVLKLIANFNGFSSHMWLFWMLNCFDDWLFLNWAYPCFKQISMFYKIRKQKLFRQETFQHRIWAWKTLIMWTILNKAFRFRRKRSFHHFIFCANWDICSIS